MIEVGTGRSPRRASKARGREEAGELTPEMNADGGELGKVLCGEGRSGAGSGGGNQRVGPGRPSSCLSRADKGTQDAGALSPGRCS